MENINTKLEYWKNRLLDLGKRNRLINCPLPKDGKRIQRHSLLINLPTPSEIWSILADGDNTLSFPVPINMHGDDDEFEPQLLSVTNGIQTNQSPNETLKTLRNLMKRASEFTEEKGLNALHLAFGFLNWIDNGAEGQEMRSPLLLLPVKLVQEDLFSPIILSRSDEEITANYSLEQKLLSDFGIELPTLNEDTDLTDYLNGVAQTVKSLGWSISDDVTQLSLFSFMKINMYRDLERNADRICGHHIIRYINGEVFRDETNMSDIVYKYNHDDTEPQEVFSVVDADSSQQDAILLAKRGSSFVLQGPPGTGKSQTITNIIAELIADGKKVLFVSEKMAALEVVYKRLTQVELAPFCLSLHNHKTKRREILEQFDKSIKLSRQRVSLQQDAYNQLYRLKEIRILLNKYSTELHTPIEPLGKTIYQVNGYLAQHENYSNIDYIQAGAEYFTPELLAQCESALEELTRIVSKSGYQQNNPWNGCVLSQITYEFRQQFIVDAQKLSSLIREGRSVFSETNRLLGTNKDWAFIAVDDVEEIYNLSKQSSCIPSAWLSLDLCKIIVDIDKCIRALELQKNGVGLKDVCETAEHRFYNEKKKYDDTLLKWQTAHNDIITNNDENILLIDATVMLSLYRNEYRTWLRVFKAGFRKAQKTLLSYRKTAEKFTYAEGLILLEKVVTVQTLKAQLEKQSEFVKFAEKEFTDAQAAYKDNESTLAALDFGEILKRLSSLLGIDFNRDVDFVIIKSKMEWAIRFQSIITQFQLGKKYIDSICNSNNEVFVRCDDNISALRAWQAKIKPDFDKYVALFDNTLKEIFYSGALSLLSEQILNCKDNFASLEYLIDYRNAEKKLMELGIDAYLAKVKEIHLNSLEIIPVFKKCFFRSWLDAIMPRFTTVSEFRRLRQDERVELFKHLDKSHIEISKAMLVSKLISRLPNFDSFSANGEIALLRREMAKQRKLMPTRLLIAALPNLLPALKPCVMMSPLSVSTYLGSSNFEFDTVIFDEASQIRTEDAIGAIFRAKQVIIAGDSKQLPPTDFFNATISTLDEYEEDETGGINDVGAYESLIDEAAMLPAQTLLWHYRSRHEHLIAFSNAKIYQGNLITFPSSVENTDGMGVEYIYVNGGTYDRGGKNGNKAEAARVADLVFEHFRLYPNRSIGIIAFGEVQQSAIHEALIEKRSVNPTFEPFFKEDKEETIFIKNLETVQGDERDTIIFSIGYAPDTAGKFIMNFGPLSRDGGERRLNVAITRARYNLKLVGSIMPTDIDPERISGQGPKLLRLYIDFAINGVNAILGETNVDNSLWFDSPFETSVYEFLTTNGYDVATQVGCSGYRIDMAVRHPKYSGRYAIGIECDGAMYHFARTARERDRLRQTVLEDMGWKIYRIWSTDWIKDRFTEGNRLLAVVKKAIDDYREVASNTNDTAVQLTDFLDMSTQTATEKMREGITQKSKMLRSRYFGWQAKDIPTRDFAETMQKVISSDYGLNKIGLFKETASYGYGWERQGSRIKANFEAAYLSLLRQGVIEEDDDGKIKLKSNV